MAYDIDPDYYVCSPTADDLHDKQYYRTQKRKYLERPCEDCPEKKTCAIECELFLRYVERDERIRSAGIRRTPKRVKL